MQENQTQYDVSIAITRYSEPDRIIDQSLRRALAQEGVCGEVIFIEQKKKSSVREDDFSQGSLKLRIFHETLHGLSAARNLALDEARHSIVLFLDADALAESGWAREIAAILSGPTYAIAGSRILPRWPGSPPLFARASVLLDQYSVLDFGTETRPLGRVVGAGFGVDAAKLPADFRFDVGLGRRGGMLFGGEESDFCNRARALGAEIAYVGRANVTHMIEPERCRWSWILKRMIFAGHGRARLGGRPSAARRANVYDWIFSPAYLPPYALGWLWGKLSV